MPTFINRAPIPRANRIPLIATTAVQTLCSTENNRADVEIATRLAADLSLGDLSNADSCKSPVRDSFGKGVIETESIVGMKCLLAGRTSLPRSESLFEAHVVSRGGDREPGILKEEYSTPLIFRLCSFAHVQERFGPCEPTIPHASTGFG